MSPTRRGRGAATEHLVANHWRTHGWPYATVKRGSGVDLENVPGVNVEIKARRDFVPTLWLKQAEHRQAGLPVVIVRPDGMGPASIGSWVAVLRHDDLIALLHAAGYGDPPSDTDVTPGAHSPQEE
jgi:hypothetical protein